MAPLTANAIEFNPAGLPLKKVGGLDRIIGASLERVWENVADWEHLPWLHSSSFSAASLLDQAAWGWRISLGTGPNQSIIELVMDKPNQRYVARTLEGSLKGMEIWTVLSIVDDHQTGIDVAFHVPDMPARALTKMGEALVTNYLTLWDEDEAMMIRREITLARRADGVDLAPVSLGSRDAVRANAPFTVDFGARTVRIVELEGDLLAFDATCPHRGGPLQDCAVVDGMVRCPWHGYQFDIRTGASTSTRLSLSGGLALVVDED